MPTPSRRPSAIVLAAVLVALEGLTALVYGVLEIGEVESRRPVVGVGVTIVMLAYAALLFAATRGLWLGRRWSRAPTVATQLILLPVAMSFRGGTTTWVSVLLVMIALPTLVAVLLPRSTRYLVPATAEPDEG